MEELWVPYNLDSRWEVSNLGRVRSWAMVGHGGRLFNRMTEPRMLVSIPEKSGYVGVRIGRPLKTRRVHDLVAEHFIGPRPTGLQVCHDDNNRANNVVTNLRYDTPLANQRDRFRHGTYVFGATASGAKLTEALAEEIVRRLLRKEPQAGIARALGTPVTPAIVGHIAKGNSWKHVWSKFNQPIPQPFYLQPSSGAS